MPVKFPPQSLCSLIAIAPLIGACSLLFGQADVAVNSDAGRGSHDGGPVVPSDAGPTLAWVPVVEWSQVLQPFRTAGVVQEDDTTLKLIGELRGPLAIPGGGSVEPSGSADFGFMSINADDGTPLSIDAFGGSGTLNILHAASLNGAQSIVGTFEGDETFCPFVGCAVPPQKIGAFASVYDEVPTVMAIPASVATLTYSEAKTTGGLYFTGAIPFTDRHILVGYSDRAITLTSPETDLQIPNTGSDMGRKNLFILTFGSRGEINNAVTNDLPGDQIAWAAEPSGNTDLFVVGTYTANLDFGLGESSTLPKSSEKALFVLHANRGLSTAHWTKAFGTGVSAHRVVAKTAPDGGLIVAGSFDDSLSLPDSTVLEGFGGGETVFVLKISSDGTVEWSNTYGTASDPARVHGLVVGPDGEVSIAGEFKGEMAVGSSTIASEDNFDTFLVRLDTFGRTRGGIRLNSYRLPFDLGLQLFGLEDDSVLIEVFDPTLSENGGANDTPIGRTLYRIR